MHAVAAVISGCSLGSEIMLVIFLKTVASGSLHAFAQIVLHQHVSQPCRASSVAMATGQLHGDVCKVNQCRSSRDRGRATL